MISPDEKMDDAARSVIYSDGSFDKYEKTVKRLFYLEIFLLFYGFFSLFAQQSNYSLGTIFSVRGYGEKLLFMTQRYFSFFWYVKLIYVLFLIVIFLVQKEIKKIESGTRHSYGKLIPLLSLQVVLLLLLPTYINWSLSFLLLITGAMMIKFHRGS